MHSKREMYALAAVLVTSYTALAFVLFFVNAPQVRAGVGLLLVLPLMLSGARMGLVEEAMKHLTPARYPRRFLRLRSHVEVLLGEIRRLNGIAVDARQGVRDQAEANTMMDAIERRLITLIAEIRASAGEPDPSVVVEEGSGGGDQAGRQLATQVV